MPKVGSKHFAYDAKGYRQAKQYALKTGKKMVVSPPKKKGK